MIFVDVNVSFFAEQVPEVAHTGRRADQGTLRVLAGQLGGHGQGRLRGLCGGGALQRTQGRGGRLHLPGVKGRGEGAGGTGERWTDKYWQTYRLSRYRTQRCGIPTAWVNLLAAVKKQSHAVTVIFTDL